MNDSHTDFQLRPARREDFPFAWLLYRDLMKPLTEELLEWNEAGQKKGVELALTRNDTSIIVANGSNAGWLHIEEEADSIYLGHLYLLPSLQNRGIATAIMQGLKNRGRSEGKAITLDVMKNNRARLLYQRLGFRIVGETTYKLNMRWQPDL